MATPADTASERPSIFSRVISYPGHPVSARLSLEPPDAQRSDGQTAVQHAAAFESLEPAEQLAKNTRLYLDHCHRVLSIPLHVYPREEWAMWLRAKDRAGRAMLGATLRVEERSLRRR